MKKVLKVMKSAAEYVTIKCGRGFLSRQFAGTTYLAAATELIKNPRDWGATAIWIWDNIRPNLVRFADNGVGMNPENQTAFCSLNVTTATKVWQAGLYDTGSKKFLFGFSERVDVRTVFQDDPDYVSQFALVTADYENQVMGSAPNQIPVTRVLKTPETWPFDFPTGTVLDYTLRDPKSRAILRGKSLAEAMSARYPDKFKDIIQINGTFIPGKGENAKLFHVVEQHPQLGQVSIEIYQVAKKRIREEMLLLSAGEIGEVPFSSFLSGLGELQADIDDVYGLATTAGVIQVPYLKEYINEDRKSLNPRFIDDKRTMQLLFLLKRFAPIIESRLGLHLKQDEEQAGGHRVVDELITRCNKKYNPKGDIPRDFRKPDDVVPPPPVRGPEEDDVFGGTDEDERKEGVKIGCQREYEVGEPIQIRLAVSKNLTLDPAKLKWQTDHSLAKDIRSTDKGLEMVAAREGYARVSLDVVGTPYSANCHYVVVGKRKFKLSSSQSVLKVGQFLNIMTINSDKLKGEVKWEMAKDSVGKLEANGKRAVYFATRWGKATVWAYDSLNPKGTRVACEIDVIRPDDEYLTIRNHHFRVRFTVTEQGMMYERKPVVIKGSSAGKVHDIFFNTKHPAYVKADQTGSLQEFLLMELAIEYVRFCKFDLEQIHVEMASFDVPEAFSAIQKEADVIYLELKE